MRILFYLPVVTPWWFTSIIEPLVRKLVALAEVHILVPPAWSGTGIGPAELTGCADIHQVHWHIFDGDSHPSMRTDPEDRAAIIDFVRSLAPDYVLCRSADFMTVRGFPGKVRYMMEAGAAPLAIPNNWIVFADQQFDHGCMPVLAPDERSRLDCLIEPMWERLSRTSRPFDSERRAFRHSVGLPEDRQILALPLEYEHEENFFPMHRVGATPNRRLIAELDAAIDDSFYLAITNHPLNELHVDNSLLEAEVAAHGSRMRLLPGLTAQGRSMTMATAWDSQGMIFGDSKVYAMAAFAGTPMLRRTRFKSGDWLNAYTDLAAFLAAVANGQAAVADPSDTRRWFAFHIANSIMDPDDPELTVADILARLDRDVDPARWEGGFARYRAAVPEHFL